MTNEQPKAMNKRCISIVPIFNHLTDDEMSEIVKTTRSQSYGRNDLIFQPGAGSSSLYIVHRGRVKIYRLSETGKEQLVRMLEPGDFTGELSLFSEAAPDTYAEAMEHTELCVMHRGQFQEFLLKYPAISLKVLTEFSDRLKQSEQQATRIALEPVETRLAHYLIQLSEDQDSLSIHLPLSQKDVASYLGTTPETISRKLNDLIDQGVISMGKSRHIVIEDQDALALL